MKGNTRIIKGYVIKIIISQLLFVLAAFFFCYLVTIDKEITIYENSYQATVIEIDGNDILVQVPWHDKEEPNIFLMKNREKDPLKIGDIVYVKIDNENVKYSHEPVTFNTNPHVTMAIFIIGFPLITWTMIILLSNTNKMKSFLIVIPIIIIVHSFIYYIIAYNTLSIDFAQWFISFFKPILIGLTIISLITIIITKIKKK